MHFRSIIKETCFSLLGIMVVILLIVGATFYTNPSLAGMMKRCFRISEKDTYISRSDSIEAVASSASRFLSLVSMHGVDVLNTIATTSTKNWEITLPGGVMAEFNYPNDMEILIDKKKQQVQVMSGAVKSDWYSYEK